MGVDVVDRTQLRAEGRSRDERFLDRVFTETERERIDRSPDPDLEVWILWAAKEAAFKVVSKLEPRPPVFRHRRFQVLGSDPRRPAERLVHGDRDVVTREITLDAAWEEAWVRVAAWQGPRGGQGPGRGSGPVVAWGVTTVPEARTRLGLSGPMESWLSERLRPEESRSVHGEVSALARLLARRSAAGLLHVAEERLAVVCPEGPRGVQPPFLFLDGRLAPGADVSISHDGTFLAWAARALDSEPAAGDPSARR